MGIQINGQTDRISAVDGSFSIQDLAEVNVTGVATASNFKTGTSNVHSTGYECANINATGIVTAASANFTGNVSVGGTLTYQDVTNIDSVGVVTSRNIIFSGSTGTPGQFVLRRDSDGANIGQFRSDAGTDDISIGNGGSGSLILKTGANTERVRITSAGNLGIGITNPPNLLTLGASGGPTMRLADTTSGAFSIITGGSNGDLTFSADHGNAGSSTNIIFSNDGNQERLRIDSSGDVQARRARSNTVGDVALSIQPSDSTIQYGLRIDSTNNNLNLDKASGTAANLLTVNSSGNIGVGENSPYYKLHLKTSNAQTSLSGGSGGAWGGDGIRIENENTTVGSMSLAHFRNYDADWHIGGKYVGANNSDFLFLTEGSEKLRITSAGNMGLGVTPIAPGHTTLHVGETSSGQSVRFHMTTNATGATASDGFTLSVDGSSSVVNLIQRENAALQIYTDNTSRVSVDNSGLIVNSGYRISTNLTGSTSLPNPYSLGALASATIPSYPHFPGTWMVMGSVPCNNTWHDVLHSISDSNGLFHGYSGDASSKNIFQYQYSFTSPGYGVNVLTQRFMTGSWNTGSVSFQIRNNSGSWTLQIKATSYYNSSNNAGFRLMFHSYY